MNNIMETIEHIEEYGRAYVDATEAAAVEKELNKQGIKYNKEVDPRGLVLFKEEN